MTATLMSNASVTKVTHQGAPKVPAQAMSHERAAANQTVYQSRNKTRSWDYVWKSGFAGGIAGCAVSIPWP